MSWHAVRQHLFAWAKRADIHKHITFHASRHTFAVMMLGVTDIYTVSKLLGHRELSTTQVYAHVIDRAKREAVDNMPDLLNTEKRTQTSSERIDKSGGIVHRFRKESATRAKNGRN
jgi:integrase